MRYLELSVDQPPAERNAMHQFVVDHEAYDCSRLLYREQYADDEHAALFHVAGPAGPYESALADRAGLLEYAIEACPDDTCYLYVRATMTEDDRRFADAFGQPGLIVLTPVEYRSDGSVRVSAVGPAAAVQAAVDAVPGEMGVDIRQVGEYRAGRLDERLELTPRQFEAVRAAVDVGYYRSPRAAGLEAVAEELGCGTGTAGELLRRAERTVMSNLVAGGPF
jgi:hypothetical protein